MMRLNVGELGVALLKCGSTESERTLSASERITPGLSQRAWVACGYGYKYNPCPPTPPPPAL